MSCCRLNAAEMYVDVEAVKGGDKAVQWISESGILDLFILTGPTPAAVTQQFASLSGTTAMPQLFALGYHQCRCELYQHTSPLALYSRVGCQQRLLTAA